MKHTKAQEILEHPQTVLHATERVKGGLRYQVTVSAEKKPVTLKVTRTEMDQ